MRINNCADKDVSIQAAIRAMRSDLKINIDKGYKEGNRIYFKEEIRCYGVRTPIVRGIAKKYFKIVGNRKNREIFKISEELLKSDFNEEAIIAIQLASNLNDRAESNDFYLFERWLNRYINNWSKTDNFCLSVLSHIIVRFPEHRKRVKSWTDSKNRWVRRASAVAFIQGNKRWRIHPAYLGDVFDVATYLMDDADDLVQKGFGWALKVAADDYQKEVFDFVMQHKNKMARTALRYAIEKMPSDMKRRAMQR